MKSSKSKRLIHDYNELENIFGSENILVLKPDTDTRTEHIESRSLKQTLECYRMVDDWKDKIKNEHHKVIMIDEFQFLSEDDIEWLAFNDDRYSILMLYGLDKDYTDNNFPAFKKAMKYADKVERLFATCDCCGKQTATHSKLIGGHVTGEDHILIGDMYSPRCTECLTKRI